ncbi:hypothetical protein CPB84DRAFT_1962248 [Gymnopilus junonius]|uniref:Uncharacterized protein n=1 Tax=Gymnopilus junonius TaxID=109634 RepID=A0A9P5TMC5_GYMJU|nr:hypothetical protein CPB84DRAFT_1962248 [Gymnopilus junonius]
MIIDHKPPQSGHRSGSNGDTTSSDIHSQTPLDPGPPPRRKSTVNCKCISWTLFTVILLFLAYWASKAAFLAYKSAKEPWSSLYQDPKKAYRPQDVIRPLVDSNQTFDIVATVWLRTERTVEVAELTARQEDEDEDKERDREIPGSLASILGNLNLKAKNSTMSKEDAHGLAEKAIWTGTVFRNLRLNAKHVKTKVTFRVPTEIFKKHELHSYDLRGSFVLVPNTPSPLDHVSNYSTWLPASINYPPSRSWPDGHTRTLAEEIVDAYGTFTPLLSFHNIKSRCGSADDSAVTEILDDSEDDDSEEGSDDPLFDFSGFTGSTKGRYDTQGQPPLESHPYIITRSFLRIVDITKPMNRKLYDKSHRQIKALACGVGFKVIVNDAGDDWRLCTRAYRQHGNQEVKIKLTKKNDKTGKDSTEWAYAPFLSLQENGYGPLDLVPVPVNREDCSKKKSISQDPIPDEEFVDVTWNIGFSGRTPEKILFADTVSSSAPAYNMTDTESNYLSTHSNVELTQGLAGHHFRDDYHPRRAAILTVVGVTLSCIEGLLDLHYWYSRSSTVGISVLGTILIAGGGLLDFVFETISGASLDSFTFTKFLWDLFLGLFFQIFSLLMLRAVLRADVHLSKYWIPVVRFAPASHAERASQRLESYPSKQTKLMTFGVFAALFSFCEYHQIYVIDRRGVPALRNTVTKTFVTVQLATILPAIALGWVLQVIMNFRSGSFAGTYKLAAWLNVIALLLTVGGNSPWIVGEARDSTPVTFYMLFEVVFAAAMAYQAFRYPSVSPTEDEEDTK